MVVECFQLAGLGRPVGPRDAHAYNICKVTTRPRHGDDAHDIERIERNLQIHVSSHVNVLYPSVLYARSIGTQVCLPPAQYTWSRHTQTIQHQLSLLSLLVRCTDCRLYELRPYRHRIAPVPLSSPKLVLWLRRLQAAQPRFLF